MHSISTFFSKFSNIRSCLPIVCFYGTCNYMNKLLIEFFIFNWKIILPTSIVFIWLDFQRYSSDVYLIHKEVIVKNIMKSLHFFNITNTHPIGIK